MIGKDARLANLLRELFIETELRGFLRERPFGREILDNLPGGCSLTELTIQTTEALERRGYIDQDLFEALLRAREGCREKIEMVADCWGYVPSGPFSFKRDPLQTDIPGRIAQDLRRVVTSPERIQSGFLGLTGVRRSPVQQVEAEPPVLVQDPAPIEFVGPVLESVAVTQVAQVAQTPRALQVTIHLSGRNATLTADIAGALLQGETELPDETPELDALNERVRANRRDLEAVKKLGFDLASLLFRGTLRDVYVKALDEARQNTRALDLRLRVEHPWRRLAWEFLSQPAPPHRFLAVDQDIRLTRELLPAILHPRTQAPDPPRLLFIQAQRPDLQPISTERELELLRKVWSTKSEKSEIRVLLNPDRFAIQEVVDEKPWNIVHFASHGTPGKLFLGEDITAQTLSLLLSSHAVTDACVISSCHGATGEPAPDLLGYGWQGVAGALSESGIAHIVASQAPLGDQDALRAAEKWHSVWLDTRDPIQATAATRFFLRASPAHAFGTLSHFSVGLNVGR